MLLVSQFFKIPTPSMEEDNRYSKGLRFFPKTRYTRGLHTEDMGYPGDLRFLKNRISKGFEIFKNRISNEFEIF